MVSQSGARVVGAVVTAFRPTAELLDAIASMSGQTDCVVVVDDTGSPDASGVLTRLADAGVVVVAHPANLGIAAALNSGIAALREELPSLTDVLTCDQDSRLPSGYVAALEQTRRQAVAAGIPVGMVAPAAAGNIARLPGTSGGDEVQVGGEPIQSGLLIMRETLEAVGGFDESLFIDGVDSDFYLRALDAGLVPVVARVGIDHQLGRTVRVRLGPLRPVLTVAADYRYYYRVRNLILVGQRHFRRHPAWVLRAFGKEIRHQIVTGLLAPGRRSRWRMAVRGLRGGIRGRSGRMPE